MVLIMVTDGHGLVSKATANLYGTFVFVVDVINVFRMFGPNSKIRANWPP